MKNYLKKSTIVIVSAILLISMAFAIHPSAAQTYSAGGQIYPPPGTKIPTYAQLIIGPNPVGLGQSISVDMFLAVPLESSGNAIVTDRAQGMMLYITDPNGLKTTLGPFQSDATGGHSIDYVPTILGNYSFYWTYPGQTTTGNNASSTPPGWGGLVELPSTSASVTVVVQQTPVSESAYAISPLPSSFWETPASAENIQTWYKITGPWLGLSANSFATTGSYNTSTYCNPYTLSVYAGHVLWTLPWGPGGVPGGDLGGTESSNFWTTRQYSPNFAPVIMNGVLYSTQFSDGMSTGFNNGIIAVNLFTGQEMWSINTTNTLRCGDMWLYHNPNEYGVLGPYIWTTGTLPASDTGGNFIAGPGQSSSFMNTTGTQWNLYDGTDGRYILSIVNGTALTLSVDDNQGLVGYFINNTAGSEMTYPNQGAGTGGSGVGTFTGVKVTNTGYHLDMFNFTTMLTGYTGVGTIYQPNRNTVLNFASAVQFAVPIAQNISGIPILPIFTSVNGVTENKVVLTTGFVHGQGVGSEQPGYMVVSAMDYVTGQQLMLANLTTSSLTNQAMSPYTRLANTYYMGNLYIFNQDNFAGAAFNLQTGAKVWETQLTATGGASISNYDVFNLKVQAADGYIVVLGFGGDMWAINATTGQQVWYTNTNNIMGSPGVETPYGIWPLWVFASTCQSSDTWYMAVGHEYDPPLFHGAQLLAMNISSGQLVWKELGFFTRAMAIADGIVITNSAYDNQIYAFGKGPTQTTVSTSSGDITTTSHVTITGSVLDVSPGTKQSAVALDFPNGVPAVSDPSESLWMEYVYQQQLLPTNTTGVPVTLSVIDANNNFRTIGSTTSDASGTYAYTWTPDIPGNYTVIASFAGSNSYYPSSAETHFYAGIPATAAPTATTSVTGLATTSDLMYGIVAIIIVIIIIGVVLALMMMRKRP